MITLNDIIKNKPNIFIFVYIFICILSQIFIHVDSIFLFFVFVVLNAISSFLLTIFLGYIINNIKINDSKKYNKLYLFIMDFFIILTISLIINHFKFSLAGKYEFEADMQDSINQALNNEYNELRSPIFSILFAKLPLLLSNNNTGFITIFYYLVRTSIISFVLSNLLYQNLIINLIGVFYYVFMPLSIHSELCIMKDTPCALFTMLLYYVIYQCIKEKINKKIDLKYDFPIIVLLLLINFMRLNAIIFVCLFIISLFYIYRNNLKRPIRIAISFFAIMFLINGPIYDAINIERNSRRLVMQEISGFPVSVITYVAKNNYEVLNDSEKIFVDELTKDDKEFFNDFNEKQGYESIKYRKNVASTLENRNYTELLFYTFDLILRSPKLALTQVINQTCSLYAYRYKNENDIKKPYASVYYFLQNIEIPIILLILLSTVFYKNKFILKEDMTNYILLMPIVLYSFATALIITSPWILRYYMQLQMTAPIIIINNIYKKV